MNEIANAGNSKWAADICALVLSFLILYLGLSFVRPLAGPDEGRYSEIPREMAESGDWVTPRLNGMPYFYKPPMCYWMGAVSIKLFGVNKVSVRLPNILMAIFGVVITYAAARSLYGREAGIASALMLGTSLFYFALSQILTLDMTVSVFMAGAMFSFIVALKRSGVWRGILILGFFLCCALSVLTKGLIGIVIPFVAIFIYACLVGVPTFFRTLKKGDIFWIFTGVVLFLAVALPWHILAVIENPPYENAGGIFSKKWEGQGFFWYYIIHEHILRFIDEETSKRGQPFWFFFALAPVGFMPWLLILPQSIREFFSEGWKSACRKTPEALFLISWVVFIVVFFSMSRSKLAPYILPIYPALAVIAGRYVGNAWRNPERYSFRFVKYVCVGLGFLLAVATIPLWFILSHKAKCWDPHLAAYILSTCGVFLFALSVANLKIAVSGNIKKMMVSFMLGTFGFLLFFNPIAIFIQRPDSQHLVEKIKSERKEGDVVAIAYDYNSFHDVPLWLNELTFVIGVPPEEQKFGYMRERAVHDERFLSGEKEFERVVLKGSGTGFVVAKKDKALDFGSLKSEKIAENGNLVLYKVSRK